MLEKIARAISYQTMAPFDSLSGRDQGKALSAADAVLEAMREPTEAMRKDGSSILELYAENLDPVLLAEEVFRAMIDAARTPTKEEVHG